MKISDFIKNRPYLFWHTKNFNHLSEAAIVEAVLNYGDWNDTQTLIKILGYKKTARIFAKQARQKRCNYIPAIKNYFQLYFDRYV